MNNKIENILFALLAVLFMVGAAYSASYNGNVPSDIVTTNPAAGSPPSEAWPSIKETRRALVSMSGFKNVTASSYTATYAQSIITVNATTGNKTVALPSVATVSSSSVAKSYIIVKTDSSANTVTIDPYSVETIDGAATHTLTTQYESIQIVGNGTTWVSYAHKGLDALTLNGFTAYTSSVNGGIVRRKYDGTITGTTAAATLAANSTKAGGFTPYTTSTAGGIVVRKYDGSISGVSSNMPYIRVIDIKPPATDGGTFTTGAWRDRDLNSVRSDTTGSFQNISGKLMVLPAGTYRIAAKAPAKYVASHQARLFNKSSNSVLLIGTSEYCQNSGSANQTSSYVTGRFTVTAGQRLVIQHQCGATRATDGFGASSGFTNTSSVYTVVEFTKEN